MGRIIPLALEIVQTEYSEATTDSIRRRFDIFSEEYEEESMRRFDRLLPGFATYGSDITFRLTMPGRVTNNNAHETDGNTLIWEFNSDDAIAAPVVLVAESVVGG
jgi:hypothetical protein